MLQLEKFWYCLINFYLTLSWSGYISNECVNQDSLGKNCGNGWGLVWMSQVGLRVKFIFNSRHKKRWGWMNVRWWNEGSIVMTFWVTL